MDKWTKRWVSLSLLSLLIVALIGLTMRYKIGFSFPYFTQKYLQHAHSHFAFGGWVSHTLFVLMAAFLCQHQGEGFSHRRFNALIGANLLCAYGMLVSFTAQGYGAVSIAFSTASILVGYAFAFEFWRSTASLAGTHPAVRWFRAGLVFNVLSSLGTFYLGYMMLGKSLSQSPYLASVYFYLHFQYNGWFFFACVGLLMAWLQERQPGFRQNKLVFWLFAGACVPAYGLSVLWLHLPWWIYLAAVSGAVVQVYTALVFIRWLRPNFSSFRQGVPIVAKGLLLIAGTAWGLKLLLQLGSTMPAVSQFAFGFRSVVIAYLHLVLLVGITLFLLGYMVLSKHVAHQGRSVWGLYAFAGGVLLNELVLGVQGVASITYTLVPGAAHLLVIASAIMVLGLSGLLYGHLRPRATPK